MAIWGGYVYIFIIVKCISVVIDRQTDTFILNYLRIFLRESEGGYSFHFDALVTRDNKIYITKRGKNPDSRKLIGPYCLLALF